jgi:formylglycine-generating enzyme required for sulfatase activity
MRNSTRLIATATAIAATAALLQGFTSPPTGTSPADGLARIEVAAIEYREPGEFMEGRVPVNGPLSSIGLEQPLDIMKRQVTRGEYDRCVAAIACKALDKPGDPDLPVVGVNWNDAASYAGWQSRETGEAWRLPTDREWALAAGSRYRDDAFTEVSDPANPASRWVATYAAESALQEEVDPRLRPIGSFGENEHGLLDVGGNVWEWTSTCFVRHRLDPATGEATAHENCGIRIAQGKHRAYMTGFFRDPRAGACSVGIPPANLGIRLVRESGGMFDWLGF